MCRDSSIGWMKSLRRQQARDIATGRGSSIAGRDYGYRFFRITDTAAMESGNPALASTAAIRRAASARRNYSSTLKSAVSWKNKSRGCTGSSIAGNSAHCNQLKKHGGPAGRAKSGNHSLIAFRPLFKSGTNCRRPSNRPTGEDSRKALCRRITPFVTARHCHELRNGPSSVSNAGGIRTLCVPAVRRSGLPDRPRAKYDTGVESFVPYPLEKC